MQIWEALLLNRPMGSHTVTLKQLLGPLVMHVALVKFSCRFDACNTKMLTHAYLSYNISAKRVELAMFSSAFLLIAFPGST